MTRQSDDNDNAEDLSMAIAQLEGSAVLAGRLEGCQRERNELRLRVRHLLDERGAWVDIVQHLMTQLDEVRRKCGLVP